MQRSLIMVQVIPVIALATTRPMVVCKELSTPFMKYSETVLLQVDVSRRVSISGIAPAKLMKPPRCMAEPAGFVGAATPQLERHHTQVMSLPVWRALFSSILWTERHDRSQEMNDIHCSKQTLCNALPHSSQNTRVTSATPCMVS